MLDQHRMTGFATFLGATLLAVAITIACFLVRGFLPPFMVVVLPAVIGAGLLAAGLLAKHDDGWNTHETPPTRRS